MIGGALDLLKAALTRSPEPKADETKASQTKASRTEAGASRPNAAPGSGMDGKDPAGGETSGAFGVLLAKLDRGGVLPAPPRARPPQVTAPAAEPTFGPRIPLDDGLRLSQWGPLREPPKEQGSPGMQAFPKSGQPDKAGAALIVGCPTLRRPAGKAEEAGEKTASMQAAATTVDQPAPLQLLTVPSIPAAFRPDDETSRPDVTTPHGSPQAGQTKPASLVGASVERQEPFAMPLVSEVLQETHHRPVESLSAQLAGAIVAEAGLAAGAEAASSTQASLPGEARPTHAAEPQSLPTPGEPARYLSLRLHPADLGEVGIKLALRASALALTLTIDKPSTLSAVTRESERLTHALERAGYSLDSLVIRQASPVEGHASADQSQTRNDPHDQADTGASPRHGQQRSDGEAPREERRRGSDRRGAQSQRSGRYL